MRLPLRRFEVLAVFIIILGLNYILLFLFRNFIGLSEIYIIYWLIWTNRWELSFWRSIFLKSFLWGDILVIFLSGNSLKIWLLRFLFFIFLLIKFRSYGWILFVLLLKSQLRRFWRFIILKTLILILLFVFRLFLVLLFPYIFEFKIIILLSYLIIFLHHFVNSLFALFSIHLVFTLHTSESLLEALLHLTNVKTLL